jgi:uncharacterized protein (DUF427 family)
VIKESSGIKEYVALISGADAVPPRWHMRVRRRGWTSTPGPTHRGAGLPKAVWNGVTIAESDDTVVVEGNHYFPREALRDDVLRPSDRHTVCPWKGTASYYSLELDGKRSKNAAWYYPEPKDAAKQIAGRVAFWKDVKVTP